MAAASWVNIGGVLLHHVGPAAVGSRSTDDKFHDFTCTTEPVRGRPASAKAASAHAIWAATPPGRAHLARSSDSVVAAAASDGVNGSNRSAARGVPNTSARYVTDPPIP